MMNNILQIVKMLLLFSVELLMILTIGSVHSKLYRVLMMSQRPLIKYVPSSHISLILARPTVLLLFEMSDFFIQIFFSFFFVFRLCRNAATKRKIYPM